MTLFSVLTLGLLLGMRHATDVDHVVAVTTLMSRRQSARSALLLGVFWGLGHSLTILLVGGAIILAGVVIPPRVGLLLEMAVAIMLIALGVMNLSGAAARLAHAGPSGEALPASRRLRSFVVGIVHGLAGSAAVALLVLSTIHELGWALLYLGLFGVGTVVGMLLLTTAMALPMLVAARRFGTFEHTLARITGVLSVALGVVLAYQIGYVDGLFGSDPSWTPK